MPVAEEIKDCAARSVMKVHAGSTVALECHSNDYDHNFLFWQFGNGNIIGPGNHYDENKYKYEVLSGKLLIKGVSPEESGCYNCYSQQIDGSGHSIEAVKMIVSDDNSNQSWINPINRLTSSISGAELKQHEVDVALDAVKLVAIVVSFIVIIGCAIIYYRLRRDWNKYDGRTVVPLEEDDEEEGEEIYNRTTTSIAAAPVAGPSRNASADQLYGFDNHGLDTDFNSVFQQIQIKSPSRQQPSLI